MPDLNTLAQMITIERFCLFEDETGVLLTMIFNQIKDVHDEQDNTNHLTLVECQVNEHFHSSICTSYYALKHV